MSAPESGTSPGGASPLETEPVRRTSFFSHPPSLCFAAHTALVVRRSQLTAEEGGASPEGIGLDLSPADSPAVRCPPLPVSPSHSARPGSLSVRVFPPVLFPPVLFFSQKSASLLAGGSA